jgi:hypothetical protein
MISLQHGVDEAEQRTTGNNLCVSGMDEVPAAAEGHLVRAGGHGDYRPEGVPSRRRGGKRRELARVQPGRRDFSSIGLDLSGGVSG